MYSVSSDAFEYDQNKGMGELEWTSRKAVKPLSERRYPSALDAMIDNGVQVFFVDKKTFDDVNNSDDHGYDILVGLASENMQRGTNVKSLKDLDWK